MKIRQSDVKTVRDALIVKQNGVCKVCKRPFTEADPACLDHNHKTGKIRGVLHRSCNALEGIITKAFTRLGIKIDQKVVLTGLVEYHDEHETDQTGLIHPSHKTPEEKKALLVKRRKRKAKAQKGLK